MTTKTPVLEPTQNRPPPSHQHTACDRGLSSWSRSVATPDTPLRLACLIPCFNEALVLRDTIACVLAAGLSPEDVFVVDDCSSDETGLIAASFGVRILRNACNLGKSKSIARAIEELVTLSRHDFVSVLDADTLVDRDYFTIVVRAFRADPEVVLLCGQPRSRRHNWLTAYRAVEYALSHRIYKEAQQKMNAITVAAGCASTYRIAVLEHLEWNPAILTEDADTTVQVYRKRLGRIVYEKRAVVYTQDPGTVSALQGQLRRWYTGYWQVVVCHRIPFGGQRIDAEFALLAGEALIFAMFTFMMPFWLVVSPQFAWSLPADGSNFVLHCGVRRGGEPAAHRCHRVCTPLYPSARHERLHVFQYVHSDRRVASECRRLVQSAAVRLTFVPHLDTHGGWIRCLDSFARSWDSCSSSAPLCRCRTRNRTLHRSPPPVPNVLSRERLGE